MMISKCLTKHLTQETWHVLRMCMFRQMKGMAGQILPSTEQLKEVNFLCETVGKAGWEKKLSAHCKENALVLTPDLVVEVLKLQSDLDMSLKFFRWAKKQQGYKHNTFAYNALLELMGSAKQFKIVNHLLKDMRKDCCRRNAATFIFLIRSYGHAGMLKESTDAFNEMRVSGLKLEALAYNAYLQVIVKANKIELVKLVYNQMKSDGCVPDAHTYSILFSGLCKSRSFTEVEKLLLDMTSSGGCALDLITYSTIIDALCKGKQYQRAFKVYDQMVLDGIQPNAFVFNALLHGCCFANDLHSAYGLLREMSDAGHPPDLFTYDTMVRGLIKGGSVCMAGSLITTLLQKRHSLSSFTCNAWIGSLVKLGRVKEALSFLEKEMPDHGLQPTHVTYNVLIDGLCKLGKIKQAQSVLRKMKSDGFAPNTYTLNILMSGFCRGKDLDSAFDCLVELHSEGVLPDDVTYATLIDGLCKADRIDEARVILEDMAQKGRTPNAHACVSLMNAFFREGKVQDALLLFDSMIKNGCAPNGVVYHTVIASLCKLGSLCEACKIWHQIWDRGEGVGGSSVPLDATTATLISSLCKVENLDAIVEIVTRQHQHYYETLPTDLHKVGGAS